MVVAAVLVSGAKGCAGGSNAKTGVDMTARLSCKGDRILATATGSGYPKNARIDVTFTIRGPLDADADAHPHSDRHGSWSAKSPHWSPKGDGTYKLDVDTEVKGKYIEHAGRECKRG